jgi:hypothetical protein
MVQVTKRRKLIIVHRQFRYYSRIVILFAIIVSNVIIFMALKILDSSSKGVPRH